MTSCLIHLELGRPSLVADEEEVAVSVDDDLLLEAAALGTLLLHVGAGEVAVHERRLAGGQRPHDAEADVGHAAGQRPLLAVDERIWKKEEKSTVIWMPGSTMEECDVNSTSSAIDSVVQIFCNIFSIEKSLCCREQAAKKLSTRTCSISLVISNRWVFEFIWPLNEKYDNSAGGGGRSRRG